MFYEIIIYALIAFTVYAVIDTVINKNAHKANVKIINDVFDNAAKF